MFVIKFLFVSYFALSIDYVPIEFNTKIKTCLSENLLWKELEASMISSSQSALWPNEFSNVDGEGLFENASIYVTYNIGWFSPTYAYTLKNVHVNNSFRYEAVENEHPFEGGAKITISKSKSTRALIWEGEYLTRPRQWLQRQFFKSFSKDFFKQLQKNIKALEKRQGCRLKTKVF